MLDCFGVAATLTDSGGVDYSVTGILTPRDQSSAMDAAWEETSMQAEFVCVPPVGFVLSPRDCTLTANTVEYTILSESVSNGATHTYQCERVEVNSVGGPGRRY